MKKLTVTAMCLVLLLSAVSCGKGEENTETAENTAVSTEEQTTVPETETSEETEAETDSETEEPEKTDETEENKEENSKKAEDIDISEYLSKDTPTPPLWKVTDEETGNELYLMGTIHIAGENTFPLDPKIDEIYQNCDGIAVEYNTNKLTGDMETIQKFASYIMYTDGSSIKDHLSEETYQKAKDFLSENDSYIAMLDAYTAGYWYNSIANLPVFKFKNINTVGVDSKFMQDAENDGKEIVDIETVETQGEILSGLSDKAYDFMISAYVDEYTDGNGIEELAECFSELYNLWAKGDDDSMLDIDDEPQEIEIPDEIEQEIENYEDELLKKRNRQMAERASEFIKEGKNYFFMVGSLHYAGDEGVDDFLREMGYTVEEIF